MCCSDTWQARGQKKGEAMKKKLIISAAGILTLASITSATFYATGWRVIGSSDPAIYACGLKGARSCGSWSVQPWFLTRFDGPKIVQGIHIGDYWTPMDGFKFPDDPTYSGK